MGDSTRETSAGEASGDAGGGSIRTAKIHDLRSGADGAGGGRTVLVDRLWPRGVAKDDVDLDDWFKDVAPSPDLRKWFGHDPDKFGGFADRYRHELDERAKRIPESRRGSGDEGAGSGSGNDVAADGADSEAAELAELIRAAGAATVAKPLILVYAAKDRDHNHALVLAEWLRGEVD
ncbi:DUF488 domain-containing protein [Corynebacterium hansenii]|uniref:DUF488 domain-containing protein n=1 Tax=Corynebacterium hansenii TaxID=394964 RepID=A0ABV7ZQP2_9CORY|nr:hypothetical protein CHAN_00210 [Corynebacterium hansenii]